MLINVFTNLIALLCSLVCGDIESNFDAVFNKVRSLSAKSNFSFLLCVGNFFSSESAGNLEDYKTGKKKGDLDCQYESTKF